MYDMALDNNDRVLVTGFTDGTPDRDVVVYRFLNSSVTQAFVDARVVAQNTEIFFCQCNGWLFIGVKICMNGGFSPQNATSFTFNTTGTTNLSNIANAKVYFTGTSAFFSSSNQFGSDVASPNGSFTVNGTQALSNGDNYFLASL